MPQVEVKQSRGGMKKKRETGEPITENRRVVKMGRAYYLNLPPEFVHAHRIRPGQLVPVTAGHILKVVPMLEEGDE